MSERPTLHSWRDCLEKQGHRVFVPAGETVSGFRVSPDVDTYTTVAVNPDPVLKPPYRERFFLCDPEPEQVFRVLGCPEPHRVRWLELLSRQPPGYWQDFLAGPGSWLLCRLARFPEVVAWADCGLPWEGLDCSLHRDWGMEVPASAAPLFAAGEDANLLRLFAVGDDRFADAVAACLLFASVELRDCYLADRTGAEVYLAHHHDKVVVSIPEGITREGLLRELGDAPWLFPDVSGYGSPEEEDEGSGGNKEDD
jgi:hypothetical protein